jgi:prepilin-type N-terminal cleavage/methylation domain-containing protein
MKTASQARKTSGFTLIELLTVIAIIGILAAILIPTVGAVRKRALKSQCASNLHQLGMAINLYVNDNKQTLPDDTALNANLQWLGVPQRNALMSYGMTFEMFFCKGNPTYTASHMTDANRVLTSGSHPIGYVYLPGATYSAIDQYGRNIPSKYKETRLSKVNYRLIAADINRKYNNTFSGGVNHSDQEAPYGGNHLYIDGSVKWFPASDFLSRTAMVGGGTEYFFKTED